MFFFVHLLQGHMLFPASLMDFIFAMVLFFLQMVLCHCIAVMSVLLHPVAVLEYSGIPTDDRSAATVGNERGTLST